MNLNEKTTMNNKTTLSIFSLSAFANAELGGVKECLISYEKRLYTSKSCTIEKNAKEQKAKSKGSNIISITKKTCEKMGGKFHTFFNNTSEI